MAGAQNTELFNKMASASNPLMTKLAIGKVTTELAQSESLRDQFVADPVNFLSTRYGIAPGNEESAYFSHLAQIYSDGACCKGCGCRTADLHSNASLAMKVNAAPEIG